MPPFWLKEWETEEWEMGMRSKNFTQLTQEKKQNRRQKRTIGKQAKKNFENKGFLLERGQDGRQLFSLLSFSAFCLSSSFSIFSFFFFIHFKLFFFLVSETSLFPSAFYGSYGIFLCGRLLFFLHRECRFSNLFLANFIYFFQSALLASSVVYNHVSISFVEWISKLDSIKVGWTFQISVI